MKFNESKFRNSDIDMLTLQKMFSGKYPLQVRSTLAYSGSAASKNSINASLSIKSNYDKSYDTRDNKNQVSVKNINQKLSFLSEKLAQAKKSIHFGGIKKSPMFVNLTHRNSQLNINIKDRGMVKLQFFPEQKHEKHEKHEQIEKYIKNDKKRQQMKLKMGKSKIEDFTNIEQKPKNLVKLAPDSYKNNNKKNYFVTELIRARNQNSSLAIEHLNMTMQIMKQKNQIKKQLHNRFHNTIFLPEYAELQGRKTLILDLDETLIHCSQNMQFQPDIVLDLIIEDNDVHAQIVLRPYVITFLKKIAKIWQVVVFTASYQQYADGILNQIDPENKIFHHRLYRQHCTQINQIYVKDLSRLNRDLSKIVLVDNSAYSYLLQLQNAIPIFSYYDGNDSELSSLQSYLSILEKSADVRLINKNYFKLHQYENYENPQQLIKQLYIH